MRTGVCKKDGAISRSNIVNMLTPLYFFKMLFFLCLSKRKLFIFLLSFVIRTKGSPQKKVLIGIPTISYLEKKLKCIVLIL